MSLLNRVPDTAERVEGARRSETDHLSGTDETAWFPAVAIEAAPILGTGPAKVEPS